MARTTKTAAGGYHRVTLSAPFPHEGFTYSPAHDAITVDKDVFDAMTAAGVVASSKLVDGHDVQPA